MQHIRMSNKTDDIILLISLARISFLNLTEKLNLLKKLDSYNDLAILSIEDIKNITSRNIRAVWDGRQNLLAARKEAAILEAKKIKYLLYGDEGYPALLKETPNAPFMLFYTGDASCLTGRTVSVVGTRRIAPEAKRAAVQFAYDAACDGCTVVSGLAKGVDGAAHTGAVNARFDSFEDIVSAGTKLTDLVRETPDAISAAITVANEISQNGQPIDKDEKNPIKSVHSIAGGKVIYAGIDKQLGLCVRIKHEEKISTYGNLYTLTVVPGERVKRSDIIGTYNSEKDKEFYYHLEDSVL